MKTGMGPTGLTIWIILSTVLIGAICGGLHLFLAFGEAFSSAVDNDRLKAFFALTLVFPLVMAWLAFRKKKNEKEGEA